DPGRGLLPGAHGPLGRQRTQKEEKPRDNAEPRETPSVLSAILLPPSVRPSRHRPSFRDPGVPCGTFAPPSTESFPFTVRVGRRIRHPRNPLPAPLPAAPDRRPGAAARVRNRWLPVLPEIALSP